MSQGLGDATEPTQSGSFWLLGGNWGGENNKTTKPTLAGQFLEWRNKQKDLGLLAAPSQDPMETNIGVCHSSGTCTLCEILARWDAAAGGLLRLLPCPCWGITWPGRGDKGTEGETEWGSWGMSLRQSLRLRQTRCGVSTSDFGAGSEMARQAGFRTLGAGCGPWAIVWGPLL